MRLEVRGRSVIVLRSIVREAPWDRLLSCMVVTCLATFNFTLAGCNSDSGVLPDRARDDSFLTLLDDGDSGATTSAVAAEAGPNQDVLVGERVVLNASRSSIDSTRPASYLWMQIAGPAVELQAADTLFAFFDAPVTVASDPAVLEFRLLVAQDGKTDTDTTVVQVWSREGQSNPDGVTTSGLLPDGVVPAFPGAEGVGAMARGGRGGRAVYVTNLFDYDWDEDPIPGSFRWAVEKEVGPRFVIFAVGGTIPLTRRVQMKGENGSYITIAGQTSPGDGIQFQYHGLCVRDGAHDVVIRYLRIRPGFTSWEEWDKDCLNVQGTTEAPAHDVIIDHCTLEWSIDENANVWGDVQRVTFQWCILAEGSEFGHVEGPHSDGFLAGGMYSRDVDDYLTIHHCLIASNRVRNPRLATCGAVSHLINNFICNIKSTEMQIYRKGADEPSPRVNIIGNVIERTPAWAGDLRYRQINVYGFTNDSGVVVPVDDASIFVQGNIALPDYKTDPDADDWVLVRDMQGSLQDQDLDPAKRRWTPWHDESVVPVTVDSALSVKELVLEHAGATYPRRDAVDMRIIQEARDGTGQPGFGTFEDHENWPMLRSGPALPDTDGDGMPDAWEVAQGLDPANPSDGPADAGNNGYTNLETYLNWIVQ